MITDPVLLIGGSGIVGRRTIEYLRRFYPDVPLLIGGRDREKSEKVAHRIGNAGAVQIDLGAGDLGIGTQAVGCVATLFMDEAIAGLRFAQARGVPHISISPGIIELGPEVAAFITNPGAAPVVLGTEWLVGATTIPTLRFAKEFHKLRRIRIGALLDEQDDFGPAANADLERQTKTMSAALSRRDGAFVWRTGDDADAQFLAVDGTEMKASALSPNDVLALAMATGAPDVEFNLSVGISSSRRRGEPFSAEIIIELEGEGQDGSSRRTRHAIVHPAGQMPLTGLGVAMVIARLTGLDGKKPVPPGLYFPYQLLDSDDYFRRLAEIGGEVITLEA